MIVDSKTTYYEMAARHEFGNTFRMWDGIDSWNSSGYSGPIRFRSKVPGSGVFTLVPLVGRGRILAEHDRLLRSGISPRVLVFCEPAPEEHLSFQGEVVDDPLIGGLYLTWSCAPGLTNREAMARPDGACSGLKAKIVLEHMLDFRDNAQLRSLIEEWPGHVVEFSAYSVKVGELRRNMVVWEVRKY